MRRQLLLKFLKKINIFFILILFYVNPCRAVQQLSKFLKDINIFFFIIIAAQVMLCDGSCATAAVIKIFRRNQYVFFINFGLC